MDLIDINLSKVLMLREKALLKKISWELIKQAKILIGYFYQNNHIKERQLRSK
jgi:hypothetical protein